SSSATGSGVVGLEPYRGDDRAVDGRRLLDDAVPFDGDEDLRAVSDDSPSASSRESSGQRRRPSRSRTGVLVLAIRGQPRPLAILHSQRAKLLEPHRVSLRRGHRGDAIWSLREDDYLGTFAQSSRNRFSPTSVRACWVIFFKTSKGSVTMSAPSFAATITCNGWRMEATRT